MNLLNILIFIIAQIFPAKTRSGEEFIPNPKKEKKEMALGVSFVKVNKFIENKNEINRVKYGWFAPDIKVTPQNTDNRTSTIAPQKNGNLILVDNFYSSEKQKWVIGLYRSNNLGINWEYVGYIYFYDPNNPNTYYDAKDPVVVVDLSTDSVYIACHVDVGNLDIYCLILDPNLSRVHGVPIDISGDDTWTPAITIEYKYPNNYIFIAYSYSRWTGWRGVKIYRSTDRGATWEMKADYSSWLGSYRQFLWAATGKDRIYFSYLYGENDIYVAISGDRGSTWVEKQVYHNPYTIFSNEIAASRSGWNAVIVSQSEFTPGDINIIYVYTTNGGESWGNDVVDQSIANTKTPTVTCDGMNATNDTVIGYFHCAYYKDAWVAYKRIHQDSLGIGFWYTPIWELSKDVSDGPYVEESNWAQIAISTIKGCKGWAPIISWTDTRDGEKNIYYTLPYSAVAKLQIYPDQTQGVPPGDTLSYNLWIKNAYLKDVVNILPTHTQNTWWYGYYKSDGITPLTDTNGDGYIDIDTLSSFDSIQIVIKVSPPQNVPAGISDTGIIRAMYARNGVDPIGRDSAFLITVCGLYFNLIVEPDTIANAYPKDSLIFNLRVKNLGNFKDVINIDTSKNVPWNIEIVDQNNLPLSDHNSDGIPDIDSLPSGGIANIKLKVFLPDSIIAGTKGEIFVKGMYASYPFARDSAKVEINVLEKPGILIYPDKEGIVFLNKIIFYDLNVKNESNFDDSINLNIKGIGQGWEAEIFEEDSITPITEPIYLSAYSEKKVILKVKPPSFKDTAIISSDTIFLKGYLLKYPNVKDSARIITKLGVNVDLSLFPKNLNVSEEPGKEVSLQFQITNLGEIKDVINLEYFSTKPWITGLYKTDGTPLIDTNNDGLPDVDSLPQNETKIFLLKVLIPQNANKDEINEIKIRATYAFLKNISPYKGSDSSFIEVKVKPAIFSIELKKDQEKMVPCGEFYDYPMKVILYSNTDDIVNLKAKGTSLNWKIEFLDKDKNPLSFPNLEVKANDSTIFYVRVTAPYFSLEGILPGDEFPQKLMDITKIEATSGISPEKKDSAELKTKAIPPCDIHNFANPFTKSTTFIFSIPEKGKVNLSIYDRMGRKIKTILKDEYKNEGIYFIKWDGRDSKGEEIPPDVYIYYFNFEGEKISKTIKKKMAKVSGR